MGVLFVSESHIGSHMVEDVSFLSLQGTRGIVGTERGYDLSPGLKKAIKGHKAVLIGTDLDVVGTKAATAIKNFCDKEGIKAYRVALTEKGYLRVGEFFPPERMKLLRQSERRNLEFYKKYGIGFKTAIVLGKAYSDYLKGKKWIEVKRPSGTSTITAMVKASLQGAGAISGYKKLVHLYRQGLVEYPRVDNDYILEKPFDLYPHPPLTSRGYRDKIVSPIKEKKIPLDKTDDYLLELSNERFITPATAEYYLIRLYAFFGYDFKPKKDKLKTLSLAKDLYDEYGELLKTELENIYYPQLRLSSPLIEIEKLLNFETDKLIDFLEEKLNSLTTYKFPNLESFNDIGL